MKLKDVVELIKKTKKQKWDILNWCKVKNGVMSYTAADTYGYAVMEMKIDLPDGFYHKDELIQAHKTELTPVPTEEDIESEYIEHPDVISLYSFKFTWDKLNNVKHCVYTDTDKMALNGVLFDKSNIVAIDGRRLALYPHETFGIEGEFMLPPIFLKIPFVTPIVSFGKHEENHKIIVEEGDAKITVDMHKGKYPNYNMFIPKSFEYSLTFDLEELHLVLKKMELFKLDGGKVVFKKCEDGVKVYGKNKSGHDYLFKISGSGDFDDMFAINGKMLRGMLIEKKGMVRLDFISSVAQIKVNLPNNKGTYIIMPFKIGEDTVIPDRECLSVIEKDNTLF